MSRSYRKTPIIKGGNRYDSHKHKKIASRIVRRKFNNDYDDVDPVGNHHKKKYDSWDIYDFAFMCSKKDAVKYYYSNINSELYTDYKPFTEKYPTLESYLKEWRKRYYWK